MIIVSARHLTKNFKNHVAVNQVSFQLPKNKCIALIGPNGAGKTTILRMMANLLKPTKGTIHFYTENKNKDPRSLIGYLPQHPTFYPWMTGEEFLVFSGGLTHLPKKVTKKRVSELLNKVGIFDAKDRRISDYSGGMKQRLGIAQALIHDPKLLLLDEPVSALDPLGRREILSLMGNLKKDRTILFSTHILSDAEEISDELLLLHKGKLVESGSLKDMRKKYQTAVIELEFDEEESIPFLEKVSKLSTVLSSSIVEGKIHLSVTNIPDARKEILTCAVKKNWPLRSYSIKRTSLEDLFMKVVKKNAMENIISKGTS